MNKRIKIKKEKIKEGREYFLTTLYCSFSFFNLICKYGNLKLNLRDGIIYSNSMWESINKEKKFNFNKVDKFLLDNMEEIFENFAEPWGNMSSDTYQSYLWDSDEYGLVEYIRSLDIDNKIFKTKNIPKKFKPTRVEEILAIHNNND